MKNRARKAALEGLPLYILILVIITGIVFGIIGVWLNALKYNTISGISTSYSTIDSSNAQFSKTSTGAYMFTVNQITIVVHNQAGLSLTDVTVTLTGTQGVYSVAPQAVVTSANGATITTLTGYLAANTNNGIIVVTATIISGILHSQYQTEVMVVR